MLNKKNDLSFVVLTWNSEKYINDCLQSIINKCNEEELSFEIYFIDNGSTDNSRSILNSYQDSFPETIQGIFLDKNYGTTYSRNLALRKVTGKYLCILDSDTTILSDNLKASLDYLDKHECIGILAPMLILSNGEIQHSVKKFPTFFQKMEKLKQIFGLKRSSNYDFYNDFPFREETYVDSAISACWIFKSSLLTEVGYLDENIYYAPEDMDYCLRVQTSGKKIIYYPNLKILHHTQQISHTKRFSRQSISHLFGLLYYFRKHGGWFSTKAISRRIQNSVNSK